METSLPIQKISLKQSIEEIKTETVEKLESEDEALANFVNYPEWTVFRKRLESRIETLKSKLDDLEADDMATYGAKCLSINTLVSELQSIIDEMELNAEVISKKKKNDSGTEQ